MKPRRLADLRRLDDEAHAALLKGEWWDGKRWRDKADPPRTAAEGRHYKDPIDVLAEMNAEMIGEGPVNGSSRLRAAGRFGQSAKADRNYHASTMAEIAADKIFELAKPHLKGKRIPWTKLAVRISVERKQDVTPNRLRMICRARGLR